MAATLRDIILMAESEKPSKEKKGAFDPEYNYFDAKHASARRSGSSVPYPKAAQDIMSDLLSIPE